MREWADLATKGIEAFAVVIIVASIIFSSLRFVLQCLRRVTDPYRAYKNLLGRSLLVSLELLVAADIVRTVLLDLTPRSIGMLGALVAIRTFLSWSVVVEIEGHWPWNSTPLAVQKE
jgi:uncharacterized membrane protein